MTSLLRAPAGIALAFLAGAAARAAEPSALITGADWQQRPAAFVRYLAAAKPHSPDFPKDAMPCYAARLQPGTNPEGTRKAVEKTLDAAARSRPDPFNMHAVIPDNQYGTGIELATGITATITQGDPVGNPDDVTVTVVPAGHEAGGKLFGRLKATAN